MLIIHTDFGVVELNGDAINSLEKQTEKITIRKQKMMPFPVIQISHAVLKVQMETANSNPSHYLLISF